MEPRDGEDCQPHTSWGGRRDRPQEPAEGDSACDIARSDFRPPDSGDKCPRLVISCPGPGALLRTFRGAGISRIFPLYSIVPPLKFVCGHPKPQGAVCGNGGLRDGNWVK